MIKKIIIAILLLVCMLNSGYVIAREEAEEVKETLSWTDQRMIDKLEKYSISVLIADAGNVGYCSGVLIGEGANCSYVLTAKHCIGAVEGTYAEGNKVKLVITSGNDDLAYLIVDGKIKGKEIVNIANKNEEPGNTIYLIGHPSLRKTHKVVGKVIRYTDDWGWGAIESIPGTSGGGIYNKNAELVGINWGLIWGDEIGLFEKAEDIQRFLKEIDKIK